MGRWLAMFLVLAPVAVRAQMLGDTAAALATQGGLASTSAGSAAPVLGSVKRSLESSQAAGGWGQARGTTANGWATAASANARGTGVAGCWSAKGSQNGAARGWATANNRGSTTSGWAKGNDRTGAPRR